MTGTMQPDPQVVACPDCDAPAGELCRNDRGAAVAWIHLGRRDRALEPQPLTVADIPAGQGPTSLYVGRDGALLYRHASGAIEALLAGIYATGPALAALRDHLAATLPTITREETP